jgi:cyclic pyranopterin monophosphate synthase
MTKLSHTDKKGKADMVDVGSKPVQHRVAVASGHISLSKETIRLIHDNQVKKGDVLTLSEIAGIQAAKKTPELIPLCHPLLLTKIKVKAEIDQTGVTVTSEIHCNGQTGVEMEALTAVSTALLTVYDMCKAVDKNMVIGKIRLLKKTKSPLDHN